LYIPESLYESDERDNYLSQIAGRINKNEIPAGDYKIVKTKLINILTGEKVEEGYALYDESGDYIASIWENVIKGSGTRADEIVGKFVEEEIAGKFATNNDVEKSIKVTLSNPIKILPLSLSLGAETKTLTEVVKNLKSLGYIVHPNLLISDSGDVALLFFNSQDSYDNFLEATKNLKSYKEYKKWLETGNKTKNKHGVGFIFFRERSPYNQPKLDDSLALANSIASYMIDTLRLNTAKDIDKKKPEEKKQYIRDMREFFSLSRFIECNLIKDENNNITGFEFIPNWYGHLFLKLISEKRYEGLEPVTFYKVYLPNHIKLSEEIAKVKEDEDGRYIEVPYHKSDFICETHSKILSYKKKIKEIIDSDIKNEKGELLDSVAKEAMIRSIMNSAVVTKSFIDVILRLDAKDLAGIIEKANLQYNAVRGDTFFHNKKISEVGDFFETKVMMPMPYLSAEIEIKKTSVKIKKNSGNTTTVTPKNTTTATPEQEKSGCTSSIKKGKLNTGKKNKR